ncbi:MAG TPA: hypothetical protein VFR18_14475 [Terriglobia bacterium]|nr:hypothetical protein [Terriglobia bacterium]
MDNEHLSQLYEALASARERVLVCETALRCFISEDLKQELTDYLKNVRRREQTLRETLADLHLDPDTQAPRTTGDRDGEQSLINVMERALGKGDLVMAQLVAVECVVEAGRHRSGTSRQTPAPR